MNEYFKLVEDSDLALSGSHQSAIFFCPECDALFSMKACLNRSLFPWFGYHPDDGNCRVVTDDTADIIRKRASICDHKSGPIRVKTVRSLQDLIKINKEQGHPY